MRKTRLILILILLNVFFISCSTDDSSESQEPEPNETFKLVKSEIVNDNFKSDYTYNSDNLLSSWIGTHPNFGYEIDYVYNPNGTLNQNHYREIGTGNYTQDSFFTYDNNGNLTSFNNVVSSPINDYISLTYSSNLITLIGTIEGNSNVTINLETNSSGLITKLIEDNNYTTFEYDANGNIIIVKNYNNNNVLLTTYDIGYDQNINPFYGQMESIYIERFIEFFYPFDGIYISGFEGYSFPFLKNNIVSISENANAISNYTYSYDIENYPINVNEDYSGNTFQFDITYYE